MSRQSDISFTIITCTRNAAQSLPHTIKSVAEQSHSHIKHVVMDCLSTDGTVDIALRYKKEVEGKAKERVVEVVSQRDDGLYDAMNKALSFAEGDYVLFLNAGDTLHSDATLDVVAAVACTHDVIPAIVYGDTDIVDNSRQRVRSRRLRPPKQLTWRSFKQGMTVCHQAFYVRKDIACSVAYNLRYRYSADVDWCIRVMKEAERLSLPLCNARATLADYLDEGLTTLNHRASLMERFRVMRSHYGLCTTVAMHLWFVLRAVLKR